MNRYHNPRVFYGQRGKIGQRKVSPSSANRGPSFEFAGNHPTNENLAFDGRARCTSRSSLGSGGRIDGMNATCCHSSRQAGDDRCSHRMHASSPMSTSRARRRWQWPASTTAVHRWRRRWWSPSSFWPHRNIEIEVRLDATGTRWHFRKQLIHGRIPG